MEETAIERDSSHDPAEPYEAPRIETVMTSDDIEREALYGGLSFG